MRDTKYSNPNGNYVANCYLGVTGADPNDVRFDDSECVFYSAGYLCQPGRKYVCGVLGLGFRVQG